MGIFSVDEFSKEDFEKYYLKHGYWITVGVRDRCSVCRVSITQPHINRNPVFKYCPYCGAKMDKE